MKLVSRQRNFEIAMHHAPKDGCVIECGVAFGRSLQLLVELESAGRPIFAFDSCSGLPEEWIKSKNQTWPAGSFAYDMPHFDGVSYYIGLFADTLPKWKEQHEYNVGLLHFDADLYSSAVTVLDELNERIVPGTMLTFDDMFERPDYPNWRDGEYKAFMEWKDKYSRETKTFALAHRGRATFQVLR